MQIDHLEPERQQCRNQGCGCDVEAGHPYCSEYCRQAAEFSDSPEEAPQGACGCGHSSCPEN